MPLLLVTGYPSCGKSTIVQRISEFFADKGKETLIVRDDDYTIFGRNHYNDLAKEKEHRSFLKSSVEKNLNQQNIVICDALNYIKGFRYELFLIAKLYKTTFAVVHCSADINTCLWLNAEKEEHMRYEESVINDLISRYEKPNTSNRWDSPLFEIKTGKKERSVFEIPDDMSADIEYPSPRYAHIPMEDIFKTICEGAVLRQNQSTHVVPVAPADFLHELDRTTQEVVEAIIEGQKTIPLGHYILIHQSQPSNNKVFIKRYRTLGELARLRRQFINISKVNTISEKSKVASLFIHYLNNNL
ncbi:chromatin associated protein KTI12 [Dictyocaulus viviparus]|uniref:Protein KTI12 homolog n=1 Tax=Dictyocaulus viviparus TaxID=29172 RepID=A0A0D8XZN6_DICVI|nr:chromatin associated protein KTI12 [Dictyocaulus viviparus]